MPYSRLPKWVLRDGVYYTLSKSALYVLGCLCDTLEATQDAGTIKTSSIVKTTGLSKQSVCNALSELDSAGILNREKGQARFTFHREPGVKNALPESSTVDRGGQAPLTSRSSTVDPEVKHALPTVGRNKDKPRTLIQELSSKKARDSEKDQTTEGDRSPVSDDLAARNARTAADLDRGIPAAEFDPSISSAHWHAARSNGAVAPASMPHKIPYDDGQLSIAEAGSLLIENSGWPEHRSEGQKGRRRLGELALALMRDGDDDPIPTIGELMLAAVNDDRKRNDGKTFLPKITRWIEEQFYETVATGVAS